MAHRKVDQQEGFCEACDQRHDTASDPVAIATRCWAWIAGGPICLKSTMTFAVASNGVVIVVTADRGLCGAFSANVIRAAQNFIREHSHEAVQLVTIGRKASDFFRRRTIPIRKQVFVAQALSLETAREIADGLIKDFVSEDIDGVYVVYNEFKSLIAQTVRAERLLPITGGLEAEPNQTLADYLYEPGPEAILSDLLPKHIEFQLYRVLLESAAAEQGARMTAMEAATKNASDMINHLTLTYNRIRQAAITKEIIEIVSGASAAQ